MSTPKSRVPARKRSTAPARRQAALAAADSGPTVGLQATFQYGTAPNIKNITLSTQDVSKLAPGKIQFTLAEPVDLGDLTAFLTWAAATFKFPAPDPSSWPEPFAGLATVDVTIDKLVIDQVNGNYELQITMKPPKPVTIPIINVGIVSVGLMIDKTGSAALNGQ
jgi:hypothetical protein